MSASSRSQRLEQVASFLVLAALTGSALGLAEAAWVDLSGRPTSLAAALDLVFFGSIGYGIGSLLVACIAAPFLHRSARARLDAATAIACAVASSAAIVALSLTRGLGTKQWLLLALGAAILAIALFRLMQRALERALFGFSVTGVLALHLAALAIAVLIAFVRYGHDLQRALAALGALIAVVLTIFLLRRSGALRLAWLANGAAVVALFTLPLIPQDSAAQGGHVLLITVDTLRADRVGAYGHEAARTPHLDRLAEEGFVFENALSSSPRTGPSHASILTGLYPHHHGALSNGSWPVSGLDSLPTLLSEHGFATAAIVSGWTLRSDVSGLDRYFDSYDNDFSSVVWLPEPVTELRLFKLLETVRGRQPRVERPARAATDAALGWLGRHGGSSFFLWVHYFDPHVPYDPPPEFERLHAGQPIRGFRRNWYQYASKERERLRESEAGLAYMKALYDGEVSYVDAEIGRLLLALDEAGLSGKTIVVLTADHGETLDEHEHYFGHDDLYQTSLRVPLLIRLPGSPLPPRRIDQQVRTIDLAPTLLELLGMQGLEGSDGESFAPILGGGREARRQSSLASLVDRDLELYSVVRKPFKLIWRAPRWSGARRQEAREELYDLASDPAELLDLASERPDLVRELRPLIDTQRAPRRPDSLSSEDRERLRSLGYLN